MTKRFFLILFYILSVTTTWAQEKNESEKNIDNKISIDDLYIPEGYLLDMKSILPAPPALAAPSYSWMDYKMDYKKEINYNDILSFKNGPEMGFSNFSAIYSGYGFGGNSLTLQKATFRLKNGISINTMGEYDSYGYKRYNPSALPWQKNNFNGAFEVKSKNGNFGVRVEVNRGYE